VQQADVPSADVQPAVFEVVSADAVRVESGQGFTCAGSGGHPYPGGVIKGVDPDDLDGGAAAAGSCVTADSCDQVSVNGGGAFIVVSRGR
jgi:hypothetical protein